MTVGELMKRLSLRPEDQEVRVSFGSHVPTVELEFLLDRLVDRRDECEPVDSAADSRTCTLLMAGKVKRQISRRPAGMKEVW